MRFDGLINSIDAFLSDFFRIGIPDMHFTDILEIAIIAFFIYRLVLLIKNSRAYILLRGIIFLAVFFFIASILQMSTILWIGEKFLSVGVIAILIVFQPELRAALERLGRQQTLYKLLPFFYNRQTNNRFSDKTLFDLVDSCFRMGAVKTGALICIENDMVLSEYEHTGIEIDSIVSAPLIINIFEKNTPLHDGAVIVRGDRIVAATCYLPLSSNLDIDKSAGTRHRAALGLSELTDALVLIVSEETGHVSIAYKGKLHRNITENELKIYLLSLQNPEPREEKKEVDGEEVKDGTEE